MSRLSDALEVLGRALAEATEAAVSDEMTPLFNGLAFNKDAPARLAQLEQPYVLVHGDINRMKALNSRYQLSGGNAAINHVGKVLHEIAGACGAVGFHPSGDEFFFLVPKDRIDDFRTLAKDRLTKTVFPWLGNKVIDVAMSFGYVVPRDEDFETLKRKAEQACSYAKGEDGSVVEWSAEIAAKLPLHDRFHCHACGTKLDCWTPRGTVRGDPRCPNCGDQLTSEPAGDE